MRRATEFAAPLRERSFRLLFSAQATSVVGDQIAPIAITFAVLDLTGSASDLGLALGARTLGMLVFLLVGGVWADRLPRQRLMIGSDIGRFGSQAVLAYLLIAGVAEVWQIVALQFVNGGATGFFRPAATGLTPQTVRPENLQGANALLSFNDSVAQVLGPAVAGVLIVTAGASWAIAVDAATFAVSALLLSRLSLPARPSPAPRERFWNELRQGWATVVSRTWLWITILLDVAFQVLVLATIFVLGPVIADQELGGAGAWALITTAWGAGAVLGALASVRIGFARPLLAGNALVLLVVPLMLLLAAAAGAPVVAVAAVGAGFALAMADVLYDTTLQENVPEQLLSRVAAYDWFGSAALRPLGYAAVGPIASQVGIDTTLVVAAALTAMLMLSSLTIPAIREIRSGAGRALEQH